MTIQKQGQYIGKKDGIHFFWYTNDIWMLDHLESDLFLNILSRFSSLYHNLNTKLFWYSDPQCIIIKGALNVSQNVIWGALRILSTHSVNCIVNLSTLWQINQPQNKLLLMYSGDLNTDYEYWTFWGSVFKWPVFVFCTRPTIGLPDQYMRNQDLSGIQMVGLSGIQMAFKNRTIRDPTSLGPFQ